MRPGGEGIDSIHWYSHGGSIHVRKYTQRIFSRCESLLDPQFLLTLEFEGSVHVEEAEEATAQQGVRGQKGQDGKDEKN